MKLTCSHLPSGKVRNLTSCWLLKLVEPVNPLIFILVSTLVTLSIPAKFWGLGGGWLPHPTYPSRGPCTNWAFDARPRQYRVSVSEAYRLVAWCMIIGFMLIEQYRVDRMHSLIGFIEIIRLGVADEGVTTGLGVKVSSFYVITRVRLWS